MNLVICQNTVMVTTDTAGAVTITSDPIPLEGFDQIYIITNIHYMFGATTRRLRLRAQLSNDGTTWIDDVFFDYDDASDTPDGQNISALSAFIRFVFTFEVQTGSGMIVTCFDLHGRLDHT